MATATVSTPLESRQAEAIEPLLSLEDAARILGRSHWTLRLDNKAGRIKCIRVGRNLMIAPKEVRRIIEEGLQVAASK